MGLDGAVLAALLQACAPQVAPETMMAVIRVESAGDPFRIGVNKGGALRRQPGNAADAITTAKGLMRRGASFDAGLMQINSSNFARLGLTPETVFNPCTNLRAGAHVLADNYRRASDAGHADPLRAALSEYNSGSRTRGFNNGYVGRVYAAAKGTGADPASGEQPRVSYGAAAPGDSGPHRVARLLLDAFGGRITDMVRPVDAGYGAKGSYHKNGQAVDFVPRGGVGAIMRAQIRALMAANGIRVLELFGPGDPGHNDHWHVAFAAARVAPASPAPWSVAVTTRAARPASAGQAPIMLAAAARGDGDRSAEMDGLEMDGLPPAWDVFAMADWRRRWMGDGVATP